MARSGGSALPGDAPPRPGRTEEDPTIDHWAREGERDPVFELPSAGTGLSNRLEGAGGTLERIYSGLEPRPDPSSTELPPLPPLSGAAPPRENTWPIPEREETTLAEDRLSRHKTSRPRVDDLAEGSFDEVPGGGAEPEAESVESLLGPVDEFTLSVSADLAAKVEQKLAAPAQPSRAATPAAVERKTRAATPLPPARRPAEHDPLTTGVVEAPDDVFLDAPARADAAPPAPRRLSDATAALVLDGLEDRLSPLAGEPSMGLPEVAMPPTDTGRGRLVPPVGRPAISLDPGPGPTAAELAAYGSVSEDDVSVMEPSAVPGSLPPPPPPARSEPRPPPRSAAPPTRARPESRPPVANPPTDAVSFPVRSSATPAPSRSPSTPPPAPARPSRGLDQLLTLADEPPEREETIGASLELLRVVDSPPEREETIGGSLERLDPPPVPPRRDRSVTPAPPPAAPPPPRPLELLPSVFDEPPAGEETLSGILEPVSAGLPQPQHSFPEPELGSLETRPIGNQDDSSILDRPLPVQPPNHRPLQSAQLRRQTWSPNGQPAPEPPRPRREGPARGGEGDRRSQRPAPEEEPEPGMSPLQDPLVVGAAALIGILVFAVLSVSVVLALAWIV